MRLQTFAHDLIGKSIGCRSLANCHLAVTWPAHFSIKLTAAQSINIIGHAKQAGVIDGYWHLELE